MRSSHPSRNQLANRILDLIRNAGFDLGQHLREQMLAASLGVSRTPIRSALQFLASHGIVEGRRNQGFFLTKPFEELHHIEIDVPSSADHQLYERLVRDRLAGTLPNSLTQSEIARIYNVDRVVMLRALSRLAEDGLVSRNKGHGWTFLEALDSVQTLKNSYEFRLSTEPSIFFLGTFKPDAAVLERSRRQHIDFISRHDMGSIEGVRLFEADAAFHEMLAAFSGNIFFLQAIQQQNRLRRLLEFSSYTNTLRVREWCAEHLAIIAAVGCEDLATASELMREHLSRAFAAAPVVIGNGSPSLEVDCRPTRVALESNAVRKGAGLRIPTKIQAR
jgi:DNA-binding GntR family transcriptional regulator